MRTISVIILLLLMISCEEKNNDDPIPDEKIQKNPILVGDTSATFLFDPPLILDPNNYWINDSTLTDTLRIDINENGKYEFIFTYVGECIFIDVNSERVLSKPIYETISVEVNDMVMIEEGVKYSDEFQLIKYLKLGDTLDIELDWIWQYTSILYYRSRSSGTGMFFDERKNYIAYYKPYESALGWISFLIKHDDIYIKELIIEEYGQMQIEE